MAKNQKTLLEQIDTLDPQFAETVLGLNAQELKNRIASLASQLQESETHREENAALQQAKDEVKELSGGYNDVRKAVKLKTKYIISLLNEKGSN